ncbi:hypothetical protein [Alkalilimnicola sp. S0819]|uniref:hypothetical protein n=1 Tax=Alkalilimnicola sp. S0819 TaxID=2613922 RepID=UPI001262408F|nr:hypothetical protein [Alkalilimnicola sp. S0819]KAB7622699.1 hypothetical protein F3N43_11900 [Alkalilimnicola sp. S0819]MPQ17337.1 hypothetical protein [Alkalilimnicola sp. S0819]
MLAGLAATVFIVLLFAFAPAWYYDAWVRDIYGPLVHGDPVVLVDYSHYTLPAVLLGGLLVPGLILYVQIQRRRAVPRERMLPVMKRFMAGLYLTLILLIPVPVIAGWITEQYVERQGYAHCGALFDLGVGKFSRGYVADPALCVVRWELDEALKQQGYVDALRRRRS